MTTVVSDDGTTIAYEKAGSGPAVVLVDGALCYRDFGPARDVSKLLQQDYTVYIYDRRGRGESADTLPYAPEREIEDLAAVIGATGEVPFVMGQSSGAAVVLEAAASGVPMKKIAVYEAPYVGVTLHKGVPRNYQRDLKALLDAGDRGGAVNYFMVTMVGGPFFMPLMMGLMRNVFAKLKAVAHTLPYDTAIMNGFVAPTGTFEKITVPTLVMGGSKGKANMKAATSAVAAAVPGSVQKELAGQTHQVSPVVLVPELTAFFTE
jgi:pimeloyl-ACP methyl ester carboxylesterase